jgi:L-amino acid N-acyltransferase YncA
MMFERLTSYIAHNGFLAALHAGFHWGANQFAAFGVLKGMTLEVADIPDRYINAPIRYDCGFLDEKTLYRLAETKANGLSREFLDWALQRGDRCYGLMDGARLAAYGWYSMRPTEIMPALVLHYDPSYVYMYKGFTHPDYRGQNLRGVGMAKAAQAFTHQGKKGLISYVESHNYPSLHSCHRIGYKVFGSIWIIGYHEHYLTGRTPRCRLFDFGVAHA